MHPDNRLVCGINTLRGICAIWVLFSHFGPPLTFGIEKTSYLNIAIRGFVNNAINGQAAVIVFFIISGFCIHYPQVKSLVIASTLQYYIKRLVRILVPLGVGIACATAVGVGGLESEDSVLWSLVCEIFYYFVYPVLLMIRKKIGSWDMILGVAFVCSSLVILSNPYAKGYHEFGWKFNWIVGLPSWILGCVVAESFGKNYLISIQKISIIRISIWIFSFVSNVNCHHGIFGNPITLTIFSIPASYWLLNEIWWCKARGSYVFSEWLGKWSYSLYLMHIPVHLFMAFYFPFHENYFPNLLYWLCLTSIVFLICYLFYLVVEKPSHWLAHALAKRV